MNDALYRVYEQRRMRIVLIRWMRDNFESNIGVGDHINFSTRKLSTAGADLLGSWPL